MRPRRLAALLTFCIGGGCAWQLFPRATPPTSEEQLDELVRTIDFDFDNLHSELTPSVDKLIEIGEPAIPRMLDLMLLDGEKYHAFTRFHAETVIYRIYLAKYGWNRPGPGWTDPQGQERFDAFWKSMPRLDHDAPLEERARSVKGWREWLANGCKT